MATLFRPCSVAGCNRSCHHKDGGNRGWCRRHYKRWLRHGDPEKGSQLRERQSGQCSAPGCNESAKTKGLCSEHYWRKKNRGTFERVNGLYPSRGKCRVEGCENVGRLKFGMCASHYHRYLRHGDPESGRTSNGLLMKWLRDHINYSGNDCLIWPFGRAANGYAIASLDSRRHNASRIMCELAHGKPKHRHLHAAHSCGKGHEGCVNPRHLSWKTPAENIADKLEHGTSNRGENSYGHILTENDVRSIRNQSSNISQSEIARKYGICQSHVSRIISRKAWNWLK